MDDELIFTCRRSISSAFIDSTVRLGVAQTVLLIQDNLTECFGKLQCDGVLYRERFNAFWVFTKTKVRFHRRPAWRDAVDVRTFPISNAGMRTQVNTVIAATDGAVLAVANQEACVLSLETHRPIKLSTLPYPTAGFPPAAYDEPFERFPQDFSEDDCVFEQTVRSQHIDMSRHMNNIEYIRLALSSFSDDYLQNHDVREIEVHYTGESTEGQLLRVFRRADGDAQFIRITESGRSVFEMKCVF